MPKFDIPFTMSKEFPSAVTTIGQEGNQTEELNFLGFAEDEEYRVLNSALLRRSFEFLLEKPRNLRIPIWQVDVASGTGLVAQETIKVISDIAPQTPLISIGVEPDDFARERAMQKTPTTPYHQAIFVKGSGQELDAILPDYIPEEGADLAGIHDALHEIREEDKSLTLKLMAKYLKEGGIFTFNSAFTKTGMGKDGPKWGRWKLKAIELLGSARDKEMPAITIHKPEAYVKMITDAGLTILYQGQKTITLTRDALEKISIYPNFIRGFFEDMKNANNFSLEQKSKALIEALGILNITEAERVWFEVIAQKPPQRLQLIGTNV